MTTDPTDRVVDVVALSVTAADAIGRLTRATRPSAGGLTSPGDTYDVLGALVELTGCLPQLLRQLDAFVTSQVEAHRIAVDGGDYEGDPAAAAAVAGHWLEHATSHAHALTNALDQTRQATAFMTTTDDTVEAIDVDVV